MTVVTDSGHLLGYFRALQRALVIDSDLRFGDTDLGPPVARVARSGDESGNPLPCGLFVVFQTHSLVMYLTDGGLRGPVSLVLTISQESCLRAKDEERRYPDGVQPVANCCGLCFVRYKFVSSEYSCL